jgi:hypothetical protein
MLPVLYDACRSCKGGSEIDFPVARERALHAMQGLVNLGVYLALCLVLLLIASVIQILIRDPHHRFHRHHVKVRITKYVLAW